MLGPGADIELDSIVLDMFYCSVLASQILNLFSGKEAIMVRSCDCYREETLSNVYKVSLCGRLYLTDIYHDRTILRQTPKKKTCVTMRLDCVFITQMHHSKSKRQGPVLPALTSDNYILDFDSKHEITICIIHVCQLCETISALIQQFDCVWSQECPQHDHVPYVVEDICYLHYLPTSICTSRRAI